MKAVQMINELKKYSKECDLNLNRELIDINKYVKSGYSFGFVINMVNNEYEVYMFVTSDEEDVIVSNLFHKDFKYMDQAKLYYNNLIKEYSELSLEDLYNRF